MGFQPRQPGETSKRLKGDVMSAFGYLRRQVWTNPVAVTADRILNDNDITAGPTVTTFAAQPDFARLITLVASGATTANVTLNGTNIRGEVIAETVALNGTTPVSTTKAFKTITSIVFPAVAVTVDVGVKDAMGLDRCMNGNEVILATLDGVYETTRPTVTFHATDVSKNTVDPNTALNGALDLAVVFVSTEKTGLVGTSA